MIDFDTYIKMGEPGSKHPTKCILWLAAMLTLQIVIS